MGRYDVVITSPPDMAEIGMTNGDQYDGGSALL